MHLLIAASSQMPSSRNPKFAQVFVPYVSEFISGLIHSFKTFHSGHAVNNGLRCKSGQRGTAYVINFYAIISQYISSFLRFGPQLFQPLRIIIRNKKHAVPYCSLQNFPLPFCLLFPDTAVHGFNTT